MYPPETSGEVSLICPVKDHVGNIALSWAWLMTRRSAQGPCVMPVLNVERSPGLSPVGRYSDRTFDSPLMFQFLLKKSCSPEVDTDQRRPAYLTASGGMH